MNHFIISVDNGFHHRLAHDRVGVDGLQHFVSGGFQFSCYNRFGNHVGNADPDLVIAQPFFIFGIENDLNIFTTSIGVVNLKGVSGFNKKVIINIIANTTSKTKFYTAKILRGIFKVKDQLWPSLKVEFL